MPLKPAVQAVISGGFEVGRVIIPICPVSRLCTFTCDLSRFFLSTNPDNTAQWNRITDKSPVTDHQSADGDFCFVSESVFKTEIENRALLFDERINCEQFVNNHG